MTKIIYVGTLRLLILYIVTMELKFLDCTYALCIFTEEKERVKSEMNQILFYLIM